MMRSLSTGLRLLAILSAYTIARAVTWMREEHRKVRSMNLAHMRQSFCPYLVLTAIWRVASQLAPSGNNGAGRIVGGQDADPTRYPYMVYLFGDSFCAGTVCGGFKTVLSSSQGVTQSLTLRLLPQLIAPDIILTAAHCFSLNASLGTALVGDYNISSLVEDSELHVFQEVVTHPRYYEPVPQRFPDHHDFALIKIFDTAKVGSPIKLNKDPSVPDSMPNVPLHVLGWGITNSSDSDSKSDVLKEADVSFVPNDVCKQIKAFEPDGMYNFESLVFDITLCAADFSNGEDTCNGDSGGPILLAGQNADDDLQLGVTSYGAIDCGHPEIPGVYARVSYIYDWIQEHVCRLSLNPPADFECEPPSSSTEPDLSGERVKLTLEFLADIYANEAGWIVQSPNENDVMVTYAYEPIRTYPRGAK